MADPSAMEAALAAIALHRDTIGLGLALAGAIGGLIGFAATHYFELRREKRARDGNWHALAVDMAKCGKLAATYLVDNVHAPAYRLPTRAYVTALPALQIANEITVPQALALTDYFVEVESLNRGLDEAAAALTVGTPLGPIIARNQLKAGRIKGNGEYYVAVRKLMPNFVEIVPTTQVVGGP